MTRPHSLPVLAQPVWGAVSLPTGVDGQRLVLRGALVLRNHATLGRLTVHVTHHLPLATRPRALQQQGSKVKAGRFAIAAFLRPSFVTKRFVMRSQIRSPHIILDMKGESQEIKWHHVTSQHVRAKEKSHHVTSHPNKSCHINVK